MEEKLAMVNEDGIAEAVEHNEDLAEGDKPEKPRKGKRAKKEEVHVESEVIEEKQPEVSATTQSEASEVTVAIPLEVVEAIQPKVTESTQMPKKITKFTNRIIESIRRQQAVSSGGGDSGA